MRLLQRPTLALLGLLVLVLGSPAQAGDFSKGLLWKVARDGQAPSWVFGTFHSNDPQILALPEPVRAALAESATVLVEVVTTGVVPFRLNQAMQAEDGQGLEQTLPPALLDTVLKRASEYRMDRDDVVKLKPWALTMLMGAPPSERAQERAGRFPLDTWLQQEALRTRKQLLGLETAEEQIEVFDGMPLEAQIDLVRSSLEHAAEGEFARMRALYLARDLAGLEAVWEETLTELEPATAALLRARLIDNRNSLMVKRMIKSMKKGGAFVAVGALHLPGEAGVLNLLEQRGYTVTRVY
jgi:uncharacterized protein YbaP (TraB family)